MHIHRLELLRWSAERSIATLRGTKKIDLFQPSRLDRSVPVEDVMRLLVEMKGEGKFDHIGLSECSAASLRRAHAVGCFARITRVALC